MIKLQVIGRLGKDALVNTVSNKTVINFTIAHSEKYKDAQGTQKERTVWVDCAYWTDRTAVAPYLKKGTQAFVEGSPDVRAYTTKEGKNGASLTLRVNNVQLLGGGNASNQDEGGNDADYTQQSNHPSTHTATLVDDKIDPSDDLPF